MRVGTLDMVARNEVDYAISVRWSESRCIVVPCRAVQSEVGWLKAMDGCLKLLCARGEAVRYEAFAGALGQ